MIVVAIIGILSGAAYLGLQKSRIKSDNNKVLDDLIGIANAMEQYKLDHGGSYPPIALPPETPGDPTVNGDQNVLCFNADATYAHDCATAAFVQGFIDNALLGTRYLPQVPTDPRTGTRYVYGRSLTGEYYQVAGLFQRNDGTFEARTQDNLSKGFPLPSIIRAYDGPDFVVQRDTFLPYSTNPHTLTATARSVTGNQAVYTKNGETVSLPLTESTLLNEGDLVTMGSNGSADLYFSDGSVTSLQPGAILALTDLSVETNDENGIGTKVALTLQAGKIWNKVVRLSRASEFNVETSSAIAGVRGTEFGVELQGSSSAVVSVKSGTVELLDPENLDPDSDPSTPPPPIDTVETGEAVIASDAGTVADTAYAAADLEQTFYSEIPLSNIIVPRVTGLDRPATGPVLLVENLYKTAGIDPSLPGFIPYDMKRLRVLFDDIYPEEGILYGPPATAVIPSVPYAFPLDASVTEFKNIQVRFENEDGTRVSAWSSPLTLGGTSSFSLQNSDGSSLSSEQSLRPTLTVSRQRTIPVEINETEKTFDLTLTLKNYDFANNSAPEYIATDSSGNCIVPAGTLTSEDSPAPVTGSLPAGEDRKSCALLITVTVPGLAPLTAVTLITLQRMEDLSPEANLASFGFLPSLIGFRAQESGTDTVALFWTLEMNGNGFTEMNIARLTPGADPGDDASWTPLTTIPSPITESVKSVTVPVSDLADRGEANTLRVALAYTKPDGTAGEPLTIRYLFTLGEETVTSFGFTDLNDIRATAMTVTPGTPLTLNVKVFGTTLRGGLSETAPCTYTVRDITDPANPADLGSSPVSSGRFSPAALSEAKTYEITCTLPSEVGGLKVVSPANIAKLTVTVPAVTAVGTDPSLNATTCTFTDAKTYSEKGLWITTPTAQQGCWVLAKANTSCELACQDLRIDTNSDGSFTGTGDLNVQCIDENPEGDWNDALYDGTNYNEQCGVCTILGNLARLDLTNGCYTTSAPLDYAPFYNISRTRCEFRRDIADPLGAALSLNCESAFSGKQRVCKCE